MDYEELYLQLQIMEKEFKDKLSGTQKSYNKLSKNAERGELKDLTKELSLINGYIRDYENIIAKYSHLVEGFDTQEYIESGDFASQMVQYCEAASVNIKGEFPTYEIFPYKVRIDSENQEIFLDRKKVQCMRPRYFVDSIKKGQDKLNKAAFNIEAFVNELAGAYDIASLKKASGAKPAAGSSAAGKADSASQTGKIIKREHDIFLRDLYIYMVPMQRFRKEYDIQSYAFDLSRLFVSDVVSAKDGRLFEFGTSRTASKLIRILDKDGKELYLSTIRFYSAH